AIQIQKARYLLRAQPGTQASVTFMNQGGQSQTATLKSVAERDSFTRSSLYYGVNTDNLIPVTDQILTSGDASIGYVSINSNFDDLYLVVRLFQRALDKFKAHQVAGLIIDLRYNVGGAPLGLEGFLNTQDVILGQLEYYSSESKKFQPLGDPEKFTANVEQYQFKKMALLVGPACYSACELEAYG